MGSSLKGSPSTSTTNNQPNPVTMAAYEQLLQQANQTAANNPFQAYPGSFTADMNANQLAALADVSSLPAAVGSQYINPATGLMNTGANTMLGGLSYLPAAAGMIGQGASYIPQGAGYINQGAGMIGQGADIAQSALPAFNTALGYAQQATTPLQNLIPGLMSPYINDVVNATQNQFNNANAQQGNALIGQAIAAGNAFGGDRAGVAEAQLGGQQQLAQAPVIAGLYNQGWQSALQGAEAQNQLALGAAGAANQSGAGIGNIGGIVGQLGVGMGGLGSQLGQLGVGMGGLGSQLAGVGLGQANIGSALGGLGSSLGSLGLNYGASNLQDYSTMYGMGTAQQQTQQQQLNALYNQFLMQQAFPYQQQSWLGNLVEGLGAGLGGQSQTTSQQSFNPLSSLLGLGAAGLIGLSDERAKEDIEPIGKSFSGDTIYRYRFKGSPKEEIGLMAQDVEHTRPDAVYTDGTSGLKMLDYRAATDKAARRGHFEFGGHVPHRDLGGGMNLGAAPYGQFGMPGILASGFGGMPMTPGRGGMGIPTGSPAPQPQQQNPLDPMKLVTQQLMKGKGKGGLSGLFGGSGGGTSRLPGEAPMGVDASSVSMPDIGASSTSMMDGLGGAVEAAGEGLEGLGAAAGEGLAGLGGALGGLGGALGGGMEMAGELAPLMFLANRGGAVPHYDDGGGVQGDPYGMGADYADYLVLNNMLGSERSADQMIAHMIPSGYKRGGFVDGDEDIGAKIRSIMSAVGLDERPGFADGGSDDDTDEYFTPDQVARLGLSQEERDISNARPRTAGVSTEPVPIAATDDEADQATYSAPKKKTASVPGIIAEEWRKAGMSDAGIRGVLANVNSESKFNPNLRHPDQPRWGGEAHYAHGLYQEGGQEWNNYAKWIDQQHPGADWRDPQLQSQFAAENLRDNYPKVWKTMMGASPEQAASAYVSGYLKPAANFMQARMQQYGRGVPGLDAYEGMGALPPEAAAETGLPISDAVYRTSTPTGSPRAQLMADRQAPAASSSMLGGFNPLGLSDDARKALMVGALGMAAGNSQYALQNLANGALYGMSSMQAADALSQKAAETKQKMDREDAKQAKEEDYRQAQLEQAKVKQKSEEDMALRRQRLAEHKQEFDENKGEKPPSGFEWAPGKEPKPGVPGTLQPTAGGPGDLKEQHYQDRMKQGLLDDDTVDRLAKQYVGGNPGIITGYARQPQVRAQLQEAITKELKAQGRSPEEQNAKMADFHAQSKAIDQMAVRESQIAQSVEEARKTFPLATEASENVPRGKWVPLNSLRQKGEASISDPNLRKFYNANQAVITAYSNAMSRTGVTSVEARKAADALLNPAESHEAYMAGIGQLEKEMQAALSAPDTVREAILGRISGKAPAAPVGAAPVAPTAAPAAAPKVGDRKQFKQGWGVWDGSKYVPE